MNLCAHTLIVGCGLANYLQISLSFQSIYQKIYALESIVTVGTEVETISIRITFLVLYFMFGLKRKTDRHDCYYCNLPRCAEG